MRWVCLSSPARTRVKTPAEYHRRCLAGGGDCRAMHAFPGDDPGRRQSGGSRRVERRPMVAAGSNGETGAQKNIAFTRARGAEAKGGVEGSENARTEMGGKLEKEISTAVH
ncbi:hypothetical protein BS78_03G404400 [Paspalum vaginatum]|nr:hypothetical protein BS78_03G404400 [Paspalum vaginatum]